MSKKLEEGGGPRASAKPSASPIPTGPPRSISPTITLHGQALFQKTSAEKTKIYGRPPKGRKSVHSLLSEIDSNKSKKLEELKKATAEALASVTFEDVNTADGLNSWPIEDKTILDHALLKALLTAQKNGSHHRIAVAIARAIEEVCAGDTPAESQGSKPLYAERANKHQRASEFLAEHWHAEIEAGTISQAVVRKADPKLMVGLEAEFRGNRAKLRELLPNQKMVTTRKIEAVVGGPISPTRRKQVQQALSILRNARPT